MAPIPDLPLEALPQLLDAEQILDAVRDTPHMHVDEALAIGIAAKKASLDMQEVQRVRLRRCASS